MKAKRSVKNLRINKQTVADLNIDQINDVKGGATVPICNTVTRCATACYSCIDCTILTCTTCPDCS